MEKDDSQRGYHFALDNLGCAKNQVDAEVMIRYLMDAGWSYSEDFEGADLIIVNSCGFIEPAKEESIETTIELRERYPDAKILMSGCLSQRYGGELRDGLKEADGIFGNRDLSRIVETAELLMREKRPEPVLSLPDYSEYDRSRDTLLSFPGSSYLKISEGCDHRCSFCAIPLVRGGLRSIPRETIIGEAERLIAKGVFEINLIAQDLAAYGKDRDPEGGSGFTSLLRELAELPGDFRLRLLYIHPDEFPGDLIPLIQEESKILPYFDIPFQHASKRVLRAMGRRGDADTYLRLVNTIREELPDAIIRTTFLVGYYGEGEEEFEELLDFQRRARFDWAGTFSYSPEEGTAALAYEEKPGFEREAEAAEEREKRLKEEQQRISEERMERFVGRSLRVLIEERVEEEELYLGRAYLQAPEVDGAVVLHAERELSPGAACSCRIVRRNNIDLEAVVENG